MTPVLPTLNAFDMRAQYQVILNEEQFLLCDKRLCKFMNVYYYSEQINN